MGEPERPRVFEVVDALDGLFRLVERSPTLDGSLPLRAAQACVPLLAGNALGFSLRLARPARIGRRLGAPRLVPGPGWPAPAIVAERLERLVAAGLLAPRGAFERAFAASLGRTERGVVWIWTGLLLRPAPGVWARLARAANRRNLLVDVRETFAAPGVFAPVLLGLVPHFRGGAAGVDLEGELASLAPAVDAPRIEVADLARAPELGVAHATFYDASYFSSKRRSPTRRYKKLVAKRVAPATAGRAEVVRAGPCRVEVARDGLVVSADAALPVRTRDGAPARLRFGNLLDFEARYDGLTVRLAFDRDELAARADELVRGWTALYGAPFLAAHQGALLYLTKYFTPHVAGEPHFFVKPWAFVRTAPGWSSVVEGVAGDGFEVMRGVVETDRFHATPAVFHVQRVGERLRFAAGAPLVDVYPTPRAVLAGGLASTPFPP